MNTKLVAAAIATWGLLAAGNASAIIVGGVDFGALGEAPTNQHIETTTLAETLITGNGQTLEGYGVVNTVNGDATYTATGDQLYFTFTYTSQNFTADSVEFIDGTINLYLGDTFNLLNQSSLANIGIIESYSEWVQLSGHAFTATGAELTAEGTLTGATLSFTGSGMLDVVVGGFGLGEVQNFLNANMIPDGLGGFADMVITTSGNNFVLNPHDNTTGCRDGSALAGQWCLAGSADIRGDTVTVPEPATLGLLGLGLLGMAGAMRRRKA